jgi:5-methylcytosine-specific restriction enzyme subunit McrC
MRGAVSSVSFTEPDCARQYYDRLNQDYRPLHALCRFFLSQTGPSQRVGERQMSPFLLRMDRLFEAFVARWLRAQLPSSRRLRIQESGYFDPFNEIGYSMDIVLYERGGRPLAVLDTKYKRSIQPDTADVHQVVAYAVEKGCREAILVYPRAVVAPKDFFVGPVRVRTAGFRLDGTVDAAGRELLSQIGPDLLVSAAPAA